jgi:hypothetical protein
MPIRIERDGDLERWHARRAAAYVACVAVAAGLSCAGDCPPTTSPSNDTTPPLPVLQQRYVLTQVNGQPLPYVISSGATTTRLVADTLTFTGAGSPPAASGTFTETRVVGTQQGAASETVARSSTDGTWARATNYATLELTRFVGAGEGAAAQMFLANASNPGGTAGVFARVSYTYTPR